MDTLETLRRSIDVAQDLGSVVGTMKAVSAVGLREGERAVDSMTQSVRVIQFGFQVLFRNHPELIPEDADQPPGRTLAVVFGSDQGLCGPLNRSIVAHALDHLDDDTERSLIAIGVRAARELQVAGRPADLVLPFPGAIEGIPPAVRSTLVHIDRKREERAVDRVLLIHHRPRGRSGHEPRVTQMAPLDTALLQAIARRPLPSRTIPMITLEPRVMYDGLVRAAMTYSLHRAFAEAKASEHAARLLTMHAAEQNIAERLEELRHRFNQQRQESITAEILDVISGFEAVETPTR